jgi:hypothetical protein
MKTTIKFAALGFAAAFASTITWAAPILPDATDFGPLPVATFGGSGIPNNAVAQTTFNRVTLGLTATPHFGSSPPVTNNGAGTFFAQAGIDTVNTSPSSPLALWNVGFYIGQEPGIPQNFDYFLQYDFNPATANDESTHGFIGIPRALLIPGFGTYQDSYNLGQNFLAINSVIPFTLFGVMPPSGATLSTFDPTAPGQYTFKLGAASPANIGGVVTGLAGGEVFSTSILVVVGGDNPVPTPSEWSLLLLGLASIAAASRRRQRD